MVTGNLRLFEKKILRKIRGGDVWRYGLIMSLKKLQEAKTYESC
jgi:hypothetical protein